MRLTVSKRHQQQLIVAVATRLGSDNPADGLEHILNCWIAAPALPSDRPEAPTSALVADELAGLVEF